MSEIPQGRVRRVVPLFTLTGRTAGEVVATRLQRRVRGLEPDNAVEQRAADRYVELLGRSRGVLMKAGQILSFMSLTDAGDDPDGPDGPDGATAIYQTALSRLQSQAPPMPPAAALDVIRAELGRPAEDVFARFDAVAFAAASIGQVHRARLHGGREVAVKVQYPGVDEAIRADLANVTLLTTFLRLGGAVMPDIPRLDTRALAEEIRARIGEEIDYRLEARHQREFAENYRGHPFIHVPDVVDELSTERVLVTEFVEGMGWQEAVAAPQELRDQWGEVLQRFTWGGMRRFGLCHTDPHPGNYLFHPDGAITFLDFGSVKRLTRAQVDALARMEQCGTQGDRAGLYRAAVDSGIVTADSRVDEDAVAGWLASLWLPMVGEQPFTFTPAHAARVGRDLMSPLGPHSKVIRELDLPPDFMFFLRMDAGVGAVMGGLRASGNWRELSEEHDRLRPPASELGRREAAFFGEAPWYVEAAR